MNKDFIFYIYLMSVCILAMAFFLFGFFPVKVNTGNGTDTDVFPGDICDPEKPLYSRSIDRLLLMVIDGLRYDFVDGKDGETFMPFLTRARSKNRACVVKTKVEPPTVTMPRIMSMMTGSVSNFLEVVSNFGSKELTDDNFIRWAVNRDLKVLFYGDETWLSLFPDAFYRSEGTTSFFITDYTEVDSNVTNNLISELNRSDWDILILHYLGLDHIGHLEGPKSSLVGPKLIEMDDIIRHIYRELNLHGRGNKRDMLIVTGDHGMKDSGGHGGTTDSEIYVPLVLSTLDCSKIRSNIVNQVDLAPYLSVLFGIPIPSYSIGLVHSDLLPLSNSSKLFALHYNTAHLLDMNSENNSTYYDLYNRAKGLFIEYLRNKETDFNMIESMYRTLQEILSAQFSKASRFDVYSILMANVFFFQIVILLGLNCQPVFSVVRLSCVLSLSLFIYCFHHMVCFFVYESILCKQPSSLIPIFVTFICCLNFSVIKPTEWINLTFSNQDIVLSIGALLHLLSLFSTSLIEEEHQLWYFLFSTLCIFMFHFNKSGLFLLLISHKVLRCINQTGDQWASLPDVGDWFNKHENIYYLSIIHIIGLSCILYYLKQIKVVLMPKFHKLCFSIDIVLIILIYLHKSACGVCYFPFPYFLSNNGTIEARIFFLLLFIKLLFHIFGGNSDVQPDFVRYFRLVVLFYGILDCFILISSLLYRPHNVILIPALIMYSRILSSMFPSVRHLTVLHYWLANIFYFYMGNSNSLSNIDIAPAYTGLTNYNFFIVAILVIFHTFSPIFISFTLLIINMIERGSILEELKLSSHISFLIQSLQVFIYSVMLVIQRDHLFIWSVFSPKLLYLYTITSLYIVLIFSSLIVISFILDFQKKPELPKRKKVFRGRIHK